MESRMESWEQWRQCCWEGVEAEQSQLWGEICEKTISMEILFHSTELQDQHLVKGFGPPPEPPFILNYPETRRVQEHAEPFIHA